MTRMMTKPIVLVIACTLILSACTSAKFSEQDKLSYPKASADADQVVTLISNKDNTQFTVDGKSIGSPISAGGELKILVNRQSHDIVAAAAGYQQKPHHTQPPYDERSPISFNFINNDKNGNAMSTGSSENTVVLTNMPITTPVTTPSVQASAPAPTVSHATSPSSVKAPNVSTINLDSNNKSERRVALVIGNGAYQYAPQLPNPTNDAEDVAQALKMVNFQVTLKTNASLETMADAVYQFGENLKGGGIGLFYYSGHGLQVKGENYLLPVDANLTREDDVKRKAISANDVVEKMGEGKSHLNLVFLDACRNNPFPSTTRSMGRGLIGMSAPNGTLLVFATNPDNVALDGNGRNGTYTKHLLEEINQPGLEVGMLLRKVRTAVKEETSGQQVPWENGSIEGEFYFKGD